MITNRTAPTMPIVVYWRLRYADAPCWMAAAISRIRSLPAGCATIHVIDQRPYRRASAAQASAKMSAMVMESPFEGRAWAGARWQAGPPRAPGLYSKSARL